MRQWHPIFAQLLRPAVEDYYDVQTTFPVGDAPREADFVLLRRTGRTAPPFRGLWRHLTAWNILEFKGPTVSPRPGDIELLVELGLGIDRRLRSQRGPSRRQNASAQEVSFGTWRIGWAGAFCRKHSASWDPWSRSVQGYGAAACSSVWYCW